MSISVVDAAMPVFSQALYTASIKESHSVGSLVLKVSALSHVGGSIGYAIVEGDKEGLFELDYVAGWFYFVFLLFAVVQRKVIGTTAKIMVYGAYFSA